MLGTATRKNPSLGIQVGVSEKISNVSNFFKMLSEYNTVARRYGVTLR